MYNVYCPRVKKSWIAPLHITKWSSVVSSTLPRLSLKHQRTRKVDQSHHWHRTISASSVQLLSLKKTVLDMEQKNLTGSVSSKSKNPGDCLADWLGIRCGLSKRISVLPNMWWPRVGPNVRRTSRAEDWDRFILRSAFLFKLMITGLSLDTDPGIL